MIIAVLLVLIFGILFAIQATLNGHDPVDLVFERSAIDTYVTSCLEQTADDALILLGKQGGYLDPPAFVASDTYEIAYLYDAGRHRVPAIVHVEQQLSDFIDKQMLECLDRFRGLKQLGWAVGFDASVTVTRVNERDVTFSQRFRVNVQKGVETLSFTEFEASSPVRLQHMLEIANEIVRFHQAEPEWTDLTSLSAHDVDVTVYPYKQNLLYSLEDRHSEIRGNPYLFNVALRFT